MNREDGPNPYVLHDTLQDIMAAGVGIIRNGTDLKTAIDRLGELLSEVAVVKAHGASQYNPGWHEALSMGSMMIASEAIAKAALMREESRGAHTRLDFEGEREEWGKANIVVKKGDDGAMTLTRVERSAPPKHLADIAFATLEDLESGKVGADSEQA